MLLLGNKEKVVPKDSDLELWTYGNCPVGEFKLALQAVGGTGM